MQKWLNDRPWIWIVLLLSAVVIGGFVTVVIAQLNRPEIVKTRADGRTASVRMVDREVGQSAVLPASTRVAAAPESATPTRT